MFLQKLQGLRIDVFIEKARGGVSCLFQNQQLRFNAGGLQSGMQFQRLAVRHPAVFIAVQQHHRRGVFIDMV